MAPKNSLLITPNNLILRNEGSFDSGEANHDSYMSDNILRILDYWHHSRRERLRLAKLVSIDFMNMNG